MVTVQVLADLRALLPGAAGAATLNGTNAAGDGGGGIYFWNATDTRADNGTTIIAATASPGIGRWNLNVGQNANLGGDVQGPSGQTSVKALDGVALPGVAPVPGEFLKMGSSSLSYVNIVRADLPALINNYDHLAATVVGDLRADDTAELQAAITAQIASRQSSNAAPFGDGELFTGTSRRLELPPGLFLISAPFNLTGFQSIEGNDTILVAATWDGSKYIYNDDLDFFTGVGAGARCKIKGITFRRGRRALSIQTNNVSSWVSIEDCNFYEQQGDAIWCDTNSPSTQVILERCQWDQRGIAWAQSTAYNVGDIRLSGSGNYYVCRTAGTSSGSGTGPTGTTEDITDGTAHWDFTAMGGLPWMRGVAYTSGQIRSTVTGLYQCITSGTSATTGFGPATTSTDITDGTAHWKYLHARTQRAILTAVDMMRVKDCYIASSGYEVTRVVAPNPAQTSPSTLTFEGLFGNPFRDAGAWCRNDAGIVEFVGRCRLGGESGGKSAVHNYAPIGDVNLSTAPTGIVIDESTTAAASKNLVEFYDVPNLVRIKRFPGCSDAGLWFSSGLSAGTKQSIGAKHVFDVDPLLRVVTGDVPAFADAQVSSDLPTATSVALAQLAFTSSYVRDGDLLVTLNLYSDGWTPLGYARTGVSGDFVDTSDVYGHAHSVFTASADGGHAQFQWDNALGAAASAGGIPTGVYTAVFEVEAIADAADYTFYAGDVVRIVHLGPGAHLVAVPFRFEYGVASYNGVAFSVDRLKNGQAVGFGRVRIFNGALTESAVRTMLLTTARPSTGYLMAGDGWSNTNTVNGATIGETAITTGIATGAPAWVTLTPYYVGQCVTKGGVLYQCVGCGTSGASGPSGTPGTPQTDGTASWLDRAAVTWTSQGTWTDGTVDITTTGSITCDTGNANSKVRIGTVTGSSAWAGVWFGQTTFDFTTFTLIGGTSGTALNAPTGTTIQLQYNGVTQVTIGNGTFALYGGAAATQPTVTGALSTVADAPAKAVLTSIIAALKAASGINAIIDGTT